MADIIQAKTRNKNHIELDLNESSIFSEKKESARKYHKNLITDDDDSSESEENLIKEKSEIELDKSLEEDIDEIIIIEDEIQAPQKTKKKAAKKIVDKESVAATGTYLSWEGSHAERLEEDSQKMRNVKEALERYKQVKGTPVEGIALREIITACNTYCWMKIPFLKFGKAKVRLEEVRQIRERARLELEDSRFKGIESRQQAIHASDKKTKKSQAGEKGKFGSIELLQSETRLTYGDHLLREASVAAKAATYGTAFLALPGIGMLQALTMPFRLIAKGINKLFRFVEKKFDVEATGEFRDPFEIVRPGTVSTFLLDGFKNSMGAKYSGKEKVEILKKAGEYDHTNNFKSLSEDEEELEDVSFAVERFPITKKKLAKLLKKKKKISGMTEEQKEQLLQEIKDTKTYINDHIKKVKDYIEAAREEGDYSINLDGYKDILAEESRMQALDLQEKDKHTRADLRQNASTEGFKEGLKTIADINLLNDDSMQEDKNLTKKDEEYNEEVLMQNISELEFLDINSVSFYNHFDMIKDYAENTKIFEKARKTHKLLMRGLTRGLKLDNERLIKLRAKITCLFEMQDYMRGVNKLAAHGELDLSKSEDELQEQVLNSLYRGGFGGGVIKHRIDKFGDNSAFLKYIEEDIRDSADLQKEHFKKLYKITNGVNIPKDVLKNKMDNLQKNALIYDYIKHNGYRYSTRNVEDVIKAYNKAKNKNIDSNALAREYMAFLSEKSTEDMVRLMELYEGGNREELNKIEDENERKIKMMDNRLSFFKEFIKDLKSTDWKEYDAKNLPVFFDNLDQKMTRAKLWGNTRNVANGIIETLKEKQKAETLLAGKEWDENTPIELPEDFEEFGYYSLDQLVKDFNVIQDFGNSVQSRIDTIAQQKWSSDLMAYFSPEELYNMGPVEFEKISSSLDNYGGDTASDDELEARIGEGRLQGNLGFLNVPLEYKAPVKVEIDGQIVKLSQRFTSKMNPVKVFEDEKKEYERKKLFDMKLRENVSPDQLEQESKDAKVRLDELTKIHISRDDLVINKMGLKNHTSLRQLKSYAGNMAHLNGDSEEETIRRMTALRIDLKTASDEEKKAMASEFESAFKMIEDFDLSKLNIKNYDDLLKDEYRDNLVMIQFCHEFSNTGDTGLLTKYETLMKEDEGYTNLSEEEYQKIKAKIMFLMDMANATTNLLRAVSNPLHKNYDAINLISQADGDIADRIDTLKEAAEKATDDDLYLKLSDEQEYISNTADSQRDCILRNGFIPGADMNAAFKYIVAQKH